jgi:hypothetical protein
MKTLACSRLVAAMGATLCVLLAAPVAASDDAKDPLASRAESALWWGDFDTLEQLYLDATRSTDVNAYNGRTARQSVRTGLAETFKYDNLNDAYFREFELLAERWARERPQSVLAQLLYARALYARAWHMRGQGYWSGVPQTAKQEFIRLIAKAESHIADRSSLLLKDTSAHVYLLMIGHSASWSFKQLQSVADDALSKSTQDEEALYEELVNALLPKWGGSWQAVDAFINETGRRTYERRGHEVYAVLWTRVVNDVNGNLFKETSARWPSIKQGFESMAARRAHPFYMNRLAYFACLAEDRDTARTWMARVGDQPALQHWLGGGAGGRQNFESCQRWMKSSP